MIRRSVGADFRLITQHDHAIVSAALARQVGNRQFATPTSSAIVGIELHDCGWPLHDDEPTLNGKGLPIDVFESTPQIALLVWEASAAGAIQRDESGGLLVSLHVLALSILATSNSKAADSFDTARAKTRFEVNRFQHAQIEIQEHLRRKLGLPVDVPLRHGLAEESTDAQELTLQFHFRMLQAMDQISLALCCTKPPFDQIRPVIPRPGAKAVVMQLRRTSDTTLIIDPWPFRESRIELAVPFRRMPAAPFESLSSFRAAYSAAPIESMKLMVAAS